MNRDNWQGGWLLSSVKKPDEYGAFRGAFKLDAAANVRIELIGTHWFNVWLDGQFLTEGPARFPMGHAEYETIERHLPAGIHSLAALVHSQGVSTRTLHADVIPPFFLCRVYVDDKPVELSWKCLRMDGYKASGVLISPQFAWIEWADTREIPINWQSPKFDDSSWAAPAASPAEVWDLQPLNIGHVQNFSFKPKLIHKGTLTGPFEGAEAPHWPLEGDVSWYKRILHPTEKATGVWRRYDTGKVRLGRPSFTMDVPSGSVVEFAYSETLTEKPIYDGYTHKIVADFSGADWEKDPRVAPYIPLSGGLSRNMDHFIARGGRQTFIPLTPKGGRYLEVHIQADPAVVKFIKAEYIERSYFAEPVGNLDCGDKTLNDVWTLGINTLRACAEDAVIDNPTRERGQWTGDVLLSMFITAAGYNDLRLFKRGIRQSAFCAQPDGLVAGLNPGGEAYLSTYSAQWVTSVLNYYDLTGDRNLLDEMYLYSVRNLDVFVKQLGDKGIEPFAWGFVDWGFPDKFTRTALSLHVLEAFRNMVRWCKVIGKDAEPYNALSARLEDILRKQIGLQVESGKWEDFGYHCTVLALRAHLISAPAVPSAIEFIRTHILNCFPNNPNAPQLADPSISNSQLITPYFAYYTFPPLIEYGEMDFVLDQYRTCWGWGIKNGLTTQPEVFNLNWSHCHAWASSPTAQLTKYVLGLLPQYSSGENHFALYLNPGSLKQAFGRIPFPNSSGVIKIEWKRNTDSSITYSIDTPRPVRLHLTGSDEPVLIKGKHSVHLIERHFKWCLG